MDADFVTVAEADTFEEADQRFDAWLADNRHERGQLADEDLLVDSGRSSSATGWRRYRVRKSALSQPS